MVSTRSQDVAFIVLMAGPGIPGDSTLILQSAAMRRSLGVSEEATERERALYRRLYTLIPAGDSAAVLAVGRELVRIQIAALPEEQRRALGDPDSLGEAVLRPLLTPWMRFFIGYDPRPALRRLRCPVLAINGGKDLQVLPGENLAAIESALREGGTRDVTVKELPGLNHLFQTCRLCTVMEYPQLEETMAPAALEEISGWILARFSAKR
jgi:fermentation-respiration switch protein FrsA (DUF1100 family)